MKASSELFYPLPLEGVKLDIADRLILLSSRYSCHFPFTFNTFIPDIEGIPNSEDDKHSFLSRSDAQSPICSQELDSFWCRISLQGIPNLCRIAKTKGR